MRKIITIFRTCQLLVMIGGATVWMGCSKGGETPEPDPRNPDVEQQNISILDNSVQAYMTKYNVPGVSLAVTKGEKLVYVKTYGKADKEAGEDVTPESLFRIASISKSITGIAFMKLVEEGKLSLDDKVFGNGALLGITYGTKAYSANLQAITVRHLLQHTAGAWGNSANDPMFMHPAMNADQLITWTLDNQPVQRTPGTTYDYSNFGYCILGRIVEKLTGKSYEQYVKDAILKPAGVTGMTIGGNTLADRKSKEVKYYGTPSGGADPYAYNISRMDAHGGWLASATDLVRLLVHVDGFGSKTDIINSTSVQIMTTAPALAIPSGYACGWAVNSAQHWWHTGSLPGTLTEWVRTSTGYTWAILTNTRVGGNDIINELDGIVWSAINGGAQWQDIDQF